MTNEEVDRRLALPGLCLGEARRIWGDRAEVSYEGRWASAGNAMSTHEDACADEVTVWADDPLERLLSVLGAIKESKS